MDEMARLKRSLRSAKELMRTFEAERDDCRNEIQALRNELYAYKEELHLKELHVSTLERLLDRAYARLEEAGLTGKLEFELSHDAIDVFEALPGAFTLEDLTTEAKQQGYEASRAEDFLDDYVRLGLVSLAGLGEGEPSEDQPAGRRFRKTGRTCWF